MEIELIELLKIIEVNEMYLPIIFQSNYIENKDEAEFPYKEITNSKKKYRHVSYPLYKSISRIAQYDIE